MPFGNDIAAGLELALFYSDALCKTIPAEKFAHMPSKDFNSPAFNIGHLSIYSPRILGMIGATDHSVANPAGWEDLFKAGTPCVDTPGKYPSKDEILAHFTAGYKACAAALRACPDATLAAANPGEGRMKEMFPTVGGVVNFLCVGHTQMHLGQVSMWRRTMGLGSAM